MVMFPKQQRISNLAGNTPTMLIFRNLKNVPKCKFPSDLVVAASKTGVMTSDFMTNVSLPKVSKIIPVDTVICRQIVLNNLKILNIHTCTCSLESKVFNLLLLGLG